MRQQGVAGGGKKAWRADASQALEVRGIQKISKVLIDLFHVKHGLPPIPIPHDLFHVKHDSTRARRG